VQKGDLTFELEYIFFLISKFAIHFSWPYTRCTVTVQSQTTTAFTFTHVLSFKL